LYIAEFARVRKVTLDGVIRTVAGNGQCCISSGDGGPAIAAELSWQPGIAVDGVGNLYIASDGRVRKVTLDGVIRTVAGGGKGGIGDGGPAIAAQLGPTSVAVDAGGNVYIADNGNNRVRKVTPDGLIQTVVGKSTTGFSGD